MIILYRQSPQRRQKNYNIILLFYYLMRKRCSSGRQSTDYGWRVVSENSVRWQSAKRKIGNRMPSVHRRYLHIYCGLSYRYYMPIYIYMTIYRTRLTRSWRYFPVQATFNQPRMGTDYRFLWVLLVHIY